MIKAWSHIFAHFSENPSVVYDDFLMLISSPITVVIQSDSDPTVGRLLNVSFLNNAAVENCGLNKSSIQSFSEEWQTVAVRRSK